MRALVITDFTGAYKNESFYKHKRFVWVDCTGIPGSEYFCDTRALRILRSRLRLFGPHGIHFCDSGNYHYMSKIWTDKIRVPFTLVVFDHHPDMQPPLFGDLLSCGSWVKSVLDTNKYVQKVILIGAADTLTAQIEPAYLPRLAVYNESSLPHQQIWASFARLHVTGPVYLSIDKDVLDTEEAVTDWDNGSMTLDQLRALLPVILSGHTLIGADICGECSQTLRLLDQSIPRLNDRSNRLLLDTLHNYFSKSTQPL